MKNKYKIQKLVETYSEYPADILREKSVYEWQDVEGYLSIEGFSNAREITRVLSRDNKPVNGFLGGFRIYELETGKVYCGD